MAVIFRGLKRLVRISALITIVILAAALLAIQFYPVQKTIAEQIINRIGDSPGFRIRMKSLRINWFTGSLKAEDLRIMPVPMDSPARITIDAIHADIGMLNLMTGRLAIEDWVVQKPVVTLEQLPEGNFRFPFRIPQARESQEIPDTHSGTDLVSRLSIEGARVDDASVVVIRKEQDRHPGIVKGLSVEAKVQPGLTDLNLRLAIPDARWQLRPELEYITLTKPLILQVSSGNARNATVSADAEIDGFPVTVNGSFSLLMDPVAYRIRINGAGPLTELFDHLGIPDVSIPGFDFSIDARSEGELVPTIEFQAGLPAFLYQSTRFTDINLAGSFSKTGLTAALAGKTGNGRASITASAGPVPALIPWESAIELAAFPLEALGPWIPPDVDLMGVVDGTIRASGSSRDWLESTASGNLTFRQPAGDADPNIKAAMLALNSAGTGNEPKFRLRPAGRIELEFDDRAIAISDLRLEDKSLKADLSGTFSMPERIWKVDGSIDASDLAPWLALGGVEGTGKAKLNLRLNGRNDLKQAAGNAELIASGIQFGDHNLTAVHMTASVSRSIVEAKILQFNLDDLSLAGRITADVFESDQEPQSAVMAIEMLKWKSMPQRSATLKWESSGDSRRVSLQTPENDIRASAVRTGSSGWSGSIELTDFRLEPFSPFLPDSLKDLTGSLTCEAEGSYNPPAGETSAKLRLHNLDCSVWDRSIRTGGPAVLELNSGVLSIGNMILNADDGTRISMNGSWPFKSSVDGAVAADLLLPDIRGWKIPGIPENLTGSLEAGLNLRMSQGVLLPQGELTATQCGFDEMTIDRFHSRFSRSSGTSGFRIDLELDGFRSGKAEENPEISCRGSIDLAPQAGFTPIPAAELTLDSLHVSLKSLRYSNESPVKAGLDDRMIRFHEFKLAGPEASIRISGAIPIEHSETASGLSIAASTGLGPLESIIPDAGRLGGSIRAEVLVRGSVKQPDVTGSVELTKIQLDHAALPGPVENLNGRIIILKDSIEIHDTRARFSGGSITVSGGAARTGLGLGAVDILCRGRNIDINHGGDLQVRSDSDIRIEGRWPDIGINGTVRIPDMLYSPELDIMQLLASLTRPSVVIATGGGELEKIGGIPLNLNVIARDNVRVENSNMSIRLNSQVQIIGTTKIPGILGSVTIESGTIDLLLHEFEISSGMVSFTQPFDIDPNLDIIAVTRVQDELITFRITGSASRPNLLLSSESGKSHAEIMNMLLGRNATKAETDLSTMAADYAKQALALAAAEAVAARTDLIIVPFPLTLEDENLILGVGRRFGKRWRVMYYFGEKSTEGDVIEVEFDINQKTDVRFRQNQDGSFSGGFRYRESFN